MTRGTEPFWLTAFRDITNATNERPAVSSAAGNAGVGNTAALYELAPKVAAAAAVLLGNFDSIILDWAARFSVGGTHMNFFIVKQLPVLPPEAFLDEGPSGVTYAELVIPRVLELTYTAWDLEPFARDLNYDGDPFPWDEERRHRLGQVVGPGRPVHPGLDGGDRRVLAGGQHPAGQPGQRFEDRGPETPQFLHSRFGPADQPCEDDQHLVGERLHPAHRLVVLFGRHLVYRRAGRGKQVAQPPVRLRIGRIRGCLIYTSDAADELLCVCYDGRRFIKNKTNILLIQYHTNPAFILQQIHLKHTY